MSETSVDYDEASERLSKLGMVPPIAIGDGPLVILAGGITTVTVCGICFNLVPVFHVEPQFAVAEKHFERHLKNGDIDRLKQEQDEEESDG